MHSDSSPDSAPWFDRPMRWAQLVLAEDDPGHLDLEFWLDAFRRTRADGACLSAGGYVAYYPTTIPLHHRSAWLGDGDPFGDLVAGCREMGMAVLARTDPHAVHQDVYEAHPNWIAVDAEGNPRPHWSTPGAWVTCALGPYNREFMTRVHVEIAERYQVDGIFSNRWAGHGVCYCEHCTRNFQEACGLELPRTRDPQDPRWRAYLRWRQEQLFDLCRLWDAEIRRAAPHACYVPNSGGGALSGLDMRSLGELVPLLFADWQGRRGAMAPWANGKTAKEYRAAFGSKPVGGIFSVGLEEEYRWKDSVQSEAELRIWMAEGIANGMRPWWVKFCGQVHDPRWIEPVEDVFSWHHRVEGYLRNTRPLARVGVVYSQQTAALYGGEQAWAKVETPILGVYQALVEARVPFEMVHDRLLDREHVAPFKTLVLPNVAVLSDEQCGQLEDFVARGGGLVATGETSLYDPDDEGRCRDTFGLAGLLGVDALGPAEGPIKNGYLRLEHEAAGRFAPLLEGLEEARRIIDGVTRVPVQAREPFPDPPITRVPAYPDLPMEEVYPRVSKTGEPAVHLRRVGKGRVVYFAWDVARLFWEILNVDHGLLLANAVRWATDEEPVVTVTGPGLLDVAVWEQAASLTVHLVNLTNPMAMRGPFRELIPLGEQTVRVRLPEGKHARRVHLLKAGGSPRVEEKDGYLIVTVPGVLDHEVVAVDL